MPKRPRNPFAEERHAAPPTKGSAVKPGPRRALASPKDDPPYTVQGSKSFAEEVVEDITPPKAREPLRYGLHEAPPLEVNGITAPVPPSGFISQGTHRGMVESLKDEIDPNGQLTPFQRSFVDNYVMDPTNRSQAVINAGGSEGSAKQVAHALLRRPHVAAAIARAMALRSDRTKVEQDRVLQEVYVMLTSRVDDYEMDDEGNLTLRPGVPDYMMGAVSSVKRKTRTMIHKDGSTEITREVEFRLWDKPSAAKLAGAHLGLFIKKVLTKTDNGEGDEEQEKHTWQFGDQQIVIRKDR